MTRSRHSYEQIAHASSQADGGSGRNPHAIHGVGSGGQGRNRTIDTRIFSTTEPPGSARASRRPARDCSLPDRTAPPDRAHPEPNSRIRP